MDEPSTDAAAEPSSQRPITKFTGTGGLSVAVWKHKNEDGPDRYSVRIDRTYKGDDEQFQSTQYLRDSDLLRAQKLLEQADAWIEHDKGKGTGIAKGAVR